MPNAFVTLRNKMDHLHIQYTGSVSLQSFVQVNTTITYSYRFVFVLSVHIFIIIQRA